MDNVDSTFSISHYPLVIILFSDVLPSKTPRADMDEGFWFLLLFPLLFLFQKKQHFQYCFLYPIFAFVYLLTGRIFAFCIYFSGSAMCCVAHGSAGRIRTSNLPVTLNPIFSYWHGLSYCHSHYDFRYQAYSLWTFFDISSELGCGLPFRRRTMRASRQFAWFSPRSFLRGLHKISVYFSVTVSTDKNAFISFFFDCLPRSS